MDATLITAVTALLTTGGAAVGFFIRRADRRREANEALLIDSLKAQVLKAEKDARRWKKAWQAADADAAAYREQLILNDIVPEPAHRTPLPEEEP